MSAKRCVKIVETRIDNSEIFAEAIINQDVAGHLWDIISSVNYFDLIDSPVYPDRKTIFLRELWIWEQILKPIEIIVDKLKKDLAEAQNDRI